MGVSGGLREKIDGQAKEDAARITLKIHAIQTGTVRIKACQTVGRGRGFMRQVNILLDRSWTEALPIYSEALSLQTMQRIIRYARSQPTVYLPAHDPESCDRLANVIPARVSEDVTA